MDINLAPGVAEAIQKKDRTERLQPLVVDKEFLKKRITVTSSFATAAAQQEEEEEEEEAPGKSRVRQREEQQEDEEEQPKQKAKVAVAVEPSFVVTTSLVAKCLVLVILSVLVSTTATHMVYRGLSFKEAALFTIGVGWSSTAAAATGSRHTYPIWADQHDTKSAPLALQELYAKPLLSSLENSFRTHFETGTQFACLCMHHLAIRTGSLPQFQVCSIYNRPRAEMYLLVNPTIIGRSNNTNAYSETSVSCKQQKPFSRRSNTVFLEWTEPETREIVYSRFTGMEAVCMQLALDELSGNKHCLL